MGEGFTWLTVDPDTASGHLGVCVYLFFEKNRGAAGVMEKQEEVDKWE